MKAGPLAYRLAMLALAVLCAAIAVDARHGHDQPLLLEDSLSRQYDPLLGWGGYGCRRRG